MSKNKEKIEQLLAENALAINIITNRCNDITGLQLDKTNLKAQLTAKDAEIAGLEAALEKLIGLDLIKKHHCEACSLSDLPRYCQTSCEFYVIQEQAQAALTAGKGVEDGTLS